MARMEVLQPFREAERQALAWWSLPHRQARGVRVLWRTADRIWGWAGDKAADYNRYTKRALLSGVIGATTLAWLGDDNGNMEEAEAFLDRRIENVMKWGNRLGRVKDAGGPWKIRREKTGNV